MVAYPKIIRWGFIGCGNVTEVKSGPAFRKVDGFDVVAVMRRDIGKAEDYAKRHGIPKFYGDAGQLIRDPAVDAVYIATPPDSHKRYALQVAEAGKPCCIEKPMAPSYDECAEILAAFESQSLPLFVSYYRRSLPRFNHIKQTIDNGTLGMIRHVDWHLVRSPYPKDFGGSYQWRTDPSIAPGGYFDDLASHGLDLFTYLFGDIRQSSGHSCNQQGLYQAKDAVTACWLHKAGVTGSAYWNFASYADEDRVNVHGSAGKLEFSVFKNEPIVLTNASGRTETVIENPEHIQWFHIQAMRDHLRGFSQHPSTGVTASHTSWVMDKILGKS